MKTIVIASAVALVGGTGVALAQSDSRLPILGAPRRTNSQSVEYVITWQVLHADASTKISGYYQIGKKRPDGSLYPVIKNFRNLKPPVQVRFYLEPAIPVQAGLYQVAPRVGKPSISIHRNGKFFCGTTKPQYTSLDVGCLKSD